MPKYLIERNIPNAGQMNPDELCGAARKSNHVLRGMNQNGTAVQWLHSYVTDDAINCVYIAPNAEAVREHARASGFPADRIQQIRSIMDPTTAE